MNEKYSLRINFILVYYRFIISVLGILDKVVNSIQNNFTSSFLGEVVMASDRKKIEILIEEIKKYGEQFDPAKVLTLTEIWYDSPNIDLLKGLVNECELGNFIDRPAQPNLRPLPKVLDELRKEYAKDFI